jgi:hypothetical protein
MPRHLISDAHEWINEIPTVPIYYLAKPQPRERAWQNQRGKKTLLTSLTGRLVLRDRLVGEISREVPGTVEAVVSRSRGERTAFVVTPAKVPPDPPGGVDLVEVRAIPQSRWGV